MVALGVPLGVGLGVGIPVLAAIILAIAFIVRRQSHRKASTRSNEGDLGQTEKDESGAHVDTSGRPSDATISIMTRGLPAAHRPLHTRASMASQSSTSSYFDPFDFERIEPSASGPDLVSEVNQELKNRASTIRLAAIEEAPAVALEEHSSVQPASES